MQYTLNPEKLAQQMEAWQKPWMDAFSSVSASQNVWQTQMQDVMKMWQTRDWLNPQVLENTISEENQQNWAELPFFMQMRTAYEQACIFMREHLEAAIRNMPDEQKGLLRFSAEQYLAALDPNNFLMTNPQALQEAAKTNGKSLVQGMQNFLNDLKKGRISMSDTKPFRIGETVATTPGKVVFRNEVMEILQYNPTTPKVYEKPLLIVPPCINKYYLLDLGKGKSFVEYLVAQGYQVFLISWRSAVEETKFLTWNDYIERGVITAVHTVCEISKQSSVTTVGQCIGGVLLTTALTVLKARRLNMVNAAIFLTSLVDHKNPGDIKYFVNEALVRSREAQVASGGIVSGLELQATFSFLRPKDLVWRYVQDNYLMGKSPRAFDMLYWNNDSVDLPLPMHTFFLRHFYKNKALTKAGSISVCGVPVDVNTIDIPMYFFAAEADHIVPAASVYDGVRLFSNCTDKRFVLGESGHIAGLINPVSKNRRNYWTGDDFSGHFEQWRKNSEKHAGSWWPDLIEWLNDRSGKKINAPKQMGNQEYPPIADAPGEYVRAKAIPALMTHLI